MKLLTSKVPEISSPCKDRRRDINTKYEFLERRVENVCDLRIETNVKDMKSLFRSLKQLQTAFEASPYKSIDFFLEILLFGGQSTVLHFKKKKKRVRSGIKGCS